MDLWVKDELNYNFLQNKIVKHKSIIYTNFVKISTKEIKIN